MNSFPARNSYRVKYSIRVNRRKKTLQRYYKTKREADLRMLQATQLEEASSMQMASKSHIEEWMSANLLAESDAIDVFPAYAELILQRQLQGLELTDYDEIYDMYMESSIQRSKGGATGRTHTANRSRASRIRDWLKENVPNLEQLDDGKVHLFIREMEKGHSQKTAWHYVTVLRAFVDQGVELKMCRENPARDVKYSQPKSSRSRRILTRAEIDVLLEVAPRSRDLLRGTLPVVVGFGLYAGMRDEEMVWARWDKLNQETRVYDISETTCDLTGKTWYPKSVKPRRVPYPPQLIEILKEERARQVDYRLLGDFILSGEKPYHVDSPQQAFRKMIQREGLPEDITIYSLRHTYATFMLRSVEDGGAGKDVRTVQEMLGHQDIRTTMIYLDYIKAEEHPSDGLQY